jgi:hypothetical protein
MLSTFCCLSCDLPFGTRFAAAEGGDRFLQVAALAETQLWLDLVRSGHSANYRPTSAIS